jgi:hypothetical protein
MKIILRTLIFTFPFFLNGQIVLNSGGKINISNGSSSSPVFVVLNSPPATPVTTSGANDGIIMEAEFDRLQFNLGTGTTAITVPYMSTALEQIPLTLTPTAAGAGTGNIRFSSMVAPVRSVGFDNTNYLPSDVANMAALGYTNASDKTIDRFWIIDANGYTGKPAVTLAFTYIDAEWAANGGNNIVESNLRAQRYNSAINDWEGTTVFPPAGTINTTANTVVSVTVSPSDFFRSWTLNDNSRPLPMQFASLHASCDSITWCAATEAKYYEVQQSTDGLYFFPVAHLERKINQSCYSYKINAQSSSYYRLKQVDNNGKANYSDIIPVNCDGANASLLVYPNPNNGTFFIRSSVPEEWIITNELGQIVHKTVPAEWTEVRDLEPGVYMIATLNDPNVRPQKIVVSR